MDDLERSIGDLVIANRILAKEDVVDAYGHVSIRHPQQARPLPVVALAQPGIRHQRRHHRVQARRHAGQRHPPGLSRALHPRRDLRGAAGRQRRDPFARRGRAAVQHLEDADVLRRACGERHGQPRSGLGHRREVRRRHQSPGRQHGAGPRHGEEARQELGGADARPRLRGGGRRPAQARAAVGLSAAQRPHPDGGDPDGRVQGDVGERDQDPQQFPRRLAGNAARLGVLGASAPAAARCWRAARAGSDGWRAAAASTSTST